MWLDGTERTTLSILKILGITNTIGECVCVKSRPSSYTAIAKMTCCITQEPASPETQMQSSIGRAKCIWVLQILAYVCASFYWKCPTSFRLVSLLCLQIMMTLTGFFVRQLIKHVNLLIIFFMHFLIILWGTVMWTERKPAYFLGERAMVHLFL